MNKDHADAATASFLKRQENWRQRRSRLSAQHDALVAERAAQRLVADRLAQERAIEDARHRAATAPAKRTLPVVESDGRPKTRGDCYPGPRPCAYIGCRHHLLVEVMFSGKLQFHNALCRDHESLGNVMVAKLEAMGETCSLDFADRGEHTLQEVSEAFGLTRERVRQIEMMALRKLKAAARKL